MNCFAGDDCESADATCSDLAQGAAATCTFAPDARSGCVDACECPSAPATGDATVACGEIDGDATQSECYLDCSDGQVCPDGQSCINDVACGFPTATVGGPYEACNPPEVECEDDWLCILDGIPSTIGACVGVACGTVADCPVGPADGTTACADVIPTIPGNECHLACAVDADCPAGASCYLDSLCVYPAP